jgi:predicted transcriptional regulator
MCQEDVIRYLVKNRGKPVTILDLVKVLGIGRASVSTNVGKLIRNKEIKVRRVRQGPSVRFLLSI